MRSRPTASDSSSSFPTARARCRWRRWPSLVRASLRGRATAVDFLIALGTHQPMSDAALSEHLGFAVVNGEEHGVAGGSRVFNHMWSDPATFRHIGTIPASEIRTLSGGRLDQDVPVALNRADLRLRPDRDPRPGVSARGRGLLRRQQVFLPRHRGGGSHQLHALARRPHHQLRGDRLGIHAGARGDRSRRIDGHRAHGVLRAGRDQGWRRGLVLCRRARPPGSMRLPCRRSGTSCGSTSHSRP